MLMRDPLLELKKSTTKTTENLLCMTGLSQQTYTRQQIVRVQEEEADRTNGGETFSHFSGPWAPLFRLTPNAAKLLLWEQRS